MFIRSIKLLILIVVVIMIVVLAIMVIITPIHHTQDVAAAHSTTPHTCQARPKSNPPDRRRKRLRRCACRPPGVLGIRPLGAGGLLEVLRFGHALLLPAKPQINQDSIISGQICQKTAVLAYYGQLSRLNINRRVYVWDIPNA